MCIELGVEQIITKFGTLVSEGNFDANAMVIIAMKTCDT